MPRLAAAASSPGFRPRFGRLSAAAFLLAFPLIALAQDDAAIQRYLVDLYLGDPLSTAQKVYPPARDWPAYLEPRGGVNRIHIEKNAARRFPAHVQTLWLGFKRDRLVEIELIYDAVYTREKPVEELAGDLALIYGEPRREGDRFWWSDGKTVLRAMNVSVDSQDSEGRATREIRTALQLMSAGLFHPKEK